MVWLIVLILIILLFFGLGFVAHILWIAAVIALIFLLVRAFVRLGSRR